MGSPFPHGYTNTTLRVGPGRVLKRYEGPGSEERCQRELLCLSAVRPWLPVPVVLEHDPEPPSVVMTELDGRPGQELIDEGHADMVMALVGEVLRAVQAVPLLALVGLEGEGQVVVHGDFGPQNMLIDPDGERSVVGLVDWEFAHFGTEVEDLAWAEWVLRMHHPAQVGAVRPLLEHAGMDASWPARHQAMVHRCRELMAMADARGSSDDVAVWRRRLAETEEWSEL